MDSTAVPLFLILSGRELGLSASGEARIAGSPCPLSPAAFAVPVLFLRFCFRVSGFFFPENVVKRNSDMRSVLLRRQMGMANKKLLLLVGLVLLLAPFGPSDTASASRQTDGHVLETLLHSVAERLQIGDELSARLLLRAALRCSPEHTLLALAIPSGASVHPHDHSVSVSPGAAGKTDGWSSGELTTDIGMRIASAIEAGPLMGASPSEAEQRRLRVPLLVRLSARLCLAGYLGAAAEWAHLVSAAHATIRGSTLDLI